MRILLGIKIGEKRNIMGRLFTCTRWLSEEKKIHSKTWIRQVQYFEPSIAKDKSTKDLVLIDEQ